MKFPRRIPIVLIIIITLCMVYKIFYSNFVIEYHEKEESIKYILLWNTFWDDDSWMFRQISFNNDISQNMDFFLENGLEKIGDQNPHLNP